MGWVALLGALSLAYGPPAAFFIALVWRGGPALLPVAVLAAGAAWLGLLFTALAWLAVPPLARAHAWPRALAPLALEAARGAVLAGVALVEPRVDALTDARGGRGKLLVDLPVGLAAGLASGALVAVVRHGATLAAAASRAAWRAPACPHAPAFALVAVEALATAALHAGAGVCVLDALRRRSAARAAGVLAVHLAASLAPTLGEPGAGGAGAGDGACAAGAAVQALAAGAMVAAAALVARARDYHGRRQLRAWAALHADEAQRAAEAAGGGAGRGRG